VSTCRNPYVLLGAILVRSNLYLEVLTLKLLVSYPERCSGCRSCESFCSLFHEKEINPAKSRIHVVRFEDRGVFIPAFCVQCSSPACKVVCPTQAIYEDLKTGAYLVNKKRCIGCKMCVFACPVGAMSIDRNAGAVKCDLCNGDPYCARICSSKALEYVEYDRVGMNKKRAGVTRLLGAAILREEQLVEIAKGI